MWFSSLSNITVLERDVCVCLCFFRALFCIQLTFAAQNHPKKRRQQGCEGVTCVRSPLKDWQMQIHLQGPEKEKKKVSPSSGNDQMILVHVTKSSSGRSDSCSKSYLTSKNPSSEPGSCSALNENPTARPRQGEQFGRAPGSWRLPHAKPADWWRRARNAGEFR